MRWISINIMLTLGTIVSAQPCNEKLLFDLYFGILKGGEAVFYVNDTVIDKNKEIHAVLHGYTTGLADWVYSVNDRFESFICIDNLLPKKSLKNLKEQKYSFINEVSFNHVSGEAYSKASGLKKVESGICDISSLIYHLRNSKKLNSLYKGQIIEVPFWDTDEWYHLELMYRGFEKIKTPMGEFECIRLEPQNIAGRFFNRRNPMNIWLTNDSRKLPVLMELNFSIGTVKCILRDIPTS